jgi:RNA polymerase sigma factor (sigma-70 family)
MSGTSPTPKSPGQGEFPATRWSLVLQTQRGTEPQAARALDELCQQYWFPLYAYLRRDGHSPHDAEDLTQAFFQHLLTTETLKSAQRERGRLRSFLIGALRRYLVDHARHHGAQKRGGQAKIIPIDSPESEESHPKESEWLMERDDPATTFDRAWARDLIHRVTRSVRGSYEMAGRVQVFELLQEHLAWNARGLSYRNAAVALNVSEATVRVQVFRMRQLFRERLEAEVAQTVSSPEEVTEELDGLMAVLAR